MAELIIASGFQAFRLFMEENEKVQELNTLSFAHGAAVEIYNRILDIAGMDFDREYRHPQDVALATYLSVLSARNQFLAQKAAEAVRSVENTRWSHLMVEGIEERAAAGKTTISTVGDNPISLNNTYLRDRWYFVMEDTIALEQIITTVNDFGDPRDIIPHEFVVSAGFIPVPLHNVNDFWGIDQSLHQEGAVKVGSYSSGTAQDPTGEEAA